MVQSQGLHPGASLQWFPPRRWSTHPIADFLWMASQRPPCAIPAFPLALPTQPLPLSPRSHLTLYGPVNFPETYFTEEKKKKIILFRIWFMKLLQHSLLMYILTSFSMNQSFLPHTLQDSLFLIQGPDLPTAASSLPIYSNPPHPNALHASVITANATTSVHSPLKMAAKNHVFWCTYLTQSTTVIFQGQLGSLISIYLTQAGNTLQKVKQRLPPASGKPGKTSKRNQCLLLSEISQHMLLTVQHSEKCKTMVMVKKINDCQMERGREE